MNINASIRCVPGVYAIVNAVNGHRYIGSSESLRRRLLGHLSELRRGVHHAQPLQRAWAKYGPQSFQFMVLESCDAEGLYDVEQRWLDLHKPEYNVKPVAVPGWVGQKHKAETIERMRAAQRTPEARERQRRMQKGRIGTRHTDEAKAKMRAASSGRRHSSETIKRLKDLAASSNYRHSDEMRALMSERRKGIQLSPDAIQRMRASLKGRKLSDEHRKAIADARRGVLHSEQRKARIGVGIRRADAERIASGRPARTVTKRRRDAKLTPEQAAEIRALWVPFKRCGQGHKKSDGLTIAQLGNKYGVSYTVAWKAINGVASC